MVQWYDGLFGGLIAAVTSAIFYVVAGMLSGGTPAGFFADIAQALPPLHNAPESGVIIGLGVVIHFLMAAVFGVGYSVLARRFPSMWHAPTSVLWGLGYGVFVYWAVTDVLVPITGAIDTTPWWVSLVGHTLLYGVVLSEYTTVVHRREASAATS